MVDYNTANISPRKKQCLQYGTKDFENYSLGLLHPYSTPQKLFFIGIWWSQTVAWSKDIPNLCCETGIPIGKPKRLPSITSCSQNSRYVRWLQKSKESADTARRRKACYRDKKHFWKSVCEMTLGHDISFAHYWATGDVLPACEDSWRARLLPDLSPAILAEECGLHARIGCLSCQPPGWLHFL